MNLSTRSLSLFGATALLAIAATTGRATAQVQAFYPLMTDLLDASNTYGPITLTGTPPPAPPSNGVCVNGIYGLSPGGQDVRTPMLPTLDTNDFQVDVEFNITAMPPVSGPVYIGGNSYRWIGIYLQANGIVGIKHNNSNLLWSTTTLTTGNWNSASLKFDSGVVQLIINNAIVLQATIGALNDGNNKNFTTNDYSVGKNFNGCIRNVLISNDATIGSATASAFGSGCGGASGAPFLTPGNTPQLGSTFAINAANMAPSVPVAFMTVGFSSTTSILGPLPYNLQPFGFGANCNLLISTDATVLFQTSSGAGTFNLPVPSDVAFTGLQLFFQAAVIDPAATGGFTFTNAIDAVIGT